MNHESSHGWLPTIMQRIAIGILAPGVISACSVFTGPGQCTDEARPGITVDVRDSISSAIAGSGAGLIATDGTFADTVHVFGDGIGMGLAYERAGTYTVTVEKDGYRLWSRSGVRVTEGECHVRTVGLTARLQR